MCDKSCSFCDLDVPHPPKPDPRQELNAAGDKLPCPNEYDIGNGAGSCTQLLRLGYTCAGVFCPTCPQAKYCDGTLNVKSVPSVDGL